MSAEETTCQEPHATTLPEVEVHQKKQQSNAGLEDNSSRNVYRPPHLRNPQNNRTDNLQGNLQDDGAGPSTASVKKRLDFGGMAAIEPQMNKEEENFWFYYQEKLNEEFPNENVSCWSCGTQEHSNSKPICTNCMFNKKRNEVFISDDHGEDAKLMEAIHGPLPSEAPPTADQFLPSQQRKTVTKAMNVTNPQVKENNETAAKDNEIAPDAFIDLHSNFYNYSSFREILDESSRCNWVKIAVALENVVDYCRLTFNEMATDIYRRLKNCKQNYPLTRENTVKGAFNRENPYNVDTNLFRWTYAIVSLSKSGFKDYKLSRSLGEKLDYEKEIYKVTEDTNPLLWMDEEKGKWLIMNYFAKKNHPCRNTFNEYNPKDLCAKGFDVTFMSNAAKDYLYGEDFFQIPHIHKLNEMRNKLYHNSFKETTQEELSEAIKILIKIVSEIVTYKFPGEERKMKAVNQRAAFIIKRLRRTEKAELVLAPEDGFIFVEGNKVVERARLSPKKATRANKFRGNCTCGYLT